MASPMSRTPMPADNAVVLHSTNIHEGSPKCDESMSPITRPQDRVATALSDPGKSPSALPSAKSPNPCHTSVIRNRPSACSMGGTVHAPSHPILEMSRSKTGMFGHERDFVTEYYDEYMVKSKVPERLNPSRYKRTDVERLRSEPREISYETTSHSMIGAAVSPYKYKKGDANFNGLQGAASPGGTDVTAKIVLLGESAVGKSSIALRFVRREFQPNQEATIGAAFLARTIQVSKGSVKFEIWDTAGQERYRALAPMYYRGASAALVVYDITSEDSFRKAMSWVRELRQNGDPKILITLVGNKIDLEPLRAVNAGDGERLAKEENLDFFETSAKEGINIDSMMQQLATKILETGVAQQKMGGRLEAPGARKPKKKKEECKC